jgi:hypothetical protein
MELGLAYAVHFAIGYFCGVMMERYGVPFIRRKLFGEK